MKREPVIIVMSILGALQLLFGGMGATGLGSNNDTVALIGAWGTLTVAAAIFGVQFYVRARVTPYADVVERLDGTEVVAGPANDMVGEGAVVREVTPEHDDTLRA